METKRSPLSLSRIEFLAATIAGIATWFGLRYILWNVKPYGYDPEMVEFYEEFLAFYPPLLFSKFALPTILFMAIAAIAFVRGIRKDVGHFTSLGHYAIAWHLIYFPLLSLLSVVSLYCIPIGIILSLGAVIEPNRAKSKWGNFIVIFLSIAWAIFGYYYVDQVAEVYYD